MFWERKIGEMTFAQITQNAIYATVLLILGVFLGKMFEVIIKRSFKKIKLERTRGYSFLEMFITVIKWSIYILFFNFALMQLGIPEFTDWLTSVLMVFPALTGALLLIVVGFAVSIYLRNVIEESKIDEWELLSQIVYYFVLYVFCVFAFKTALISLNSEMVNILTILMSVIVVGSFAYSKIKKSR